MMFKPRGFTLIELMISLVILAMLLVVATTTYQLLTVRWSKNLIGFDKAFSRYQNLTLLSNVVEGIFPYVVLEPSGRSTFFFVGQEQSLLAISRKGLFDSQFPEIFKLTTVSTPSGKFKLIYQSVSTKNILLKETEQEIRFERQLTLLENIDSIKISYFGWDSLLDATASPPEIPSWFQQYSGVAKRLHPQRVKYEIIIDNMQYEYTFDYRRDSYDELSRYMADSF